MEYTSEIITGIIASIFFELLRVFGLPIFQGRRYNVPDIAGNWRGYDIKQDGTKTESMLLEIKQLGTKIKAIIRRKAPTDSETRVFKYEGTFISGQVLLKWKEIKGEGYNMGALVLKLSGNLKELKGKTTYFHHDKGEIVSSDRVFEKIH